MLEYPYSPQHPMSFYCLNSQQQCYSDLLVLSPAPIQVPSQHRPHPEPPAVPASHPPTSVAPRNPTHHPGPIEESPHPHSFPHLAGSMPPPYDQRSYQFPYLTELPTPFWHPEPEKHLPTSYHHHPHQSPFIHSQHQLHPVSPAADAVPAQRIPFSTPHSASIPSQLATHPLSPAFAADTIPPTEGVGLFSSLLLASPSNSVRSDQSIDASSQESPNIDHVNSPSLPPLPISANVSPSVDYTDLNPSEVIGIKLEKEPSPQAAYDPRFLSSNLATAPDGSPRLTFNGLFNPTEPPIVSHQDTSESSVFESGEDEPTGMSHDEQASSHVSSHSTNMTSTHSPQHFRAPRLPSPIPVPNLTKKSRGRRVPTIDSINESPDPNRPFACPVLKCKKLFGRNEHLKRHVRSIHSDDKPHQCPVPTCRKEFSRHDNLRQHMRTHKGRPKC